ncbi:MAG: AI-2E family transporter [Burkholderiaceae bacterium]|nr:AI-2E family transporter [Burkholderiaceae bacterium]
MASLAGVLLWLLRPVLTPFVVGAVMAYALHPLVERLAARRVPRVLAVVVVEVLMIVLLLALLLMIVPILSQQLPLLREQIPELADRLNRSMAPWLGQYGVHVSLDSESVKAFVVKYLDANLEDWIGAVLSSARIGGSILLTLLSNAVLVPVVVFLLLLDWPKLVQRLRGLVPLRVLRHADSFVNECDGMLGQYLRGQLLVMGLLAVYYSLGLALFGFDLALPVGAFTGLAVFVPYLGFGVGMGLALLAGVLQFAGFYGVLAVAVVYGLGQLLESFFLTPRLVGERIGLSPLTVLFALLAFGQLFGFVGVLIALPLSAVMAVAVGRLRDLYLGSRLYHG